MDLPIEKIKLPMVRKKKRFKSLFIVLFGFFLVIGAIGFFVFYLPYTRIREKAQAVVAEGQGLKVDIKKNDIDLISKRLDTIDTKYAEFEKEAKSVYWAGFIPYIKDFRNGVEAGHYLIDAGIETVKAVEPYADLIGFKKGQGTSFYEKTSEERLQTAVLTLDKMLQKVDGISQSIDEAEKRIETIDPNRYPQKIGNTVVRDNIAQMKEQFKGMATLFVDAKPLLKSLPEIFGAQEEKTYLILFQNTAERRATGGFLTFYAVFKINKGKITIDRSSDIYDLDSNIAIHPVAPDKILAYHKGVSQLYIRDSNLSPDFVESIKLFNSLYSKAGNRVEYDGIITMDSKVLVDMLKIFGDTEAGGVTFSAQNDPRCDCPQVMYTLFDIVDRPVNYIKVNRKGIIGELMYQLFYKAIGFSPSKYWGRLAETLFQNLDEKDILLYFTDPKIQTAVQKLNYAGRVREYEGDYLHINNVNFAGAKSNLFIDENIHSETTIDGEAVKRKVTMTFRNPSPPSDCNLERGGLCLNATLRNWIRFYVPKGAKLVNFKGSETKVLTYDELGKTVYEGFMRVNPQGKAEVIVEYTLPPNITNDNYRLLIQKQPGVEKQTLEVDVNGVKKFEGKLNTDKEIK
ncbi:hypothetical protein A2966_04535 [Candidatus Roizmanbacteria bacterium RIFCSPLOWO2_01_FULL_41_22]|uniref:DUF4012 domain-containing protein n=2 Tax=Candidatus Roizmaniibacteriota TaxID=1752723 RepID=A0A1F7JRN6_9BACT|nr:MAG: hypothetical protein A2966_04535 [Candidatus Roizmanbacteria bacterium RIFCSPLOWO2_01_FULL_41_22]OGK58263.1 MAG: hypothetical protein A3H86_03465 [Candidatus Roizmanbacteria bacterium RIFCSPLOWO2_02_FULL_41_9]